MNGLFGNGRLADGRSGSGNGCCVPHGSDPIQDIHQKMKRFAQADRAASKPAQNAFDSKGEGRMELDESREDEASFVKINSKKPIQRRPKLLDPCGYVCKDLWLDFSRLGHFRG